MYYGSEFGIEGRKERSSDDSLRPALNYEDYKELELQTTRYAYARVLDGKSVITTVNNADNDVVMECACGSSAEYIGALTGEKVKVNGEEYTDWEIRYGLDNN